MADGGYEISPLRSRFCLRHPRDCGPRQAGTSCGSVLIIRPSPGGAAENSPRREPWETESINDQFHSAERRRAAAAQRQESNCRCESESVSRSGHACTLVMKQQVLPPRPQRGSSEARGQDDRKGRRSPAAARKGSSAPRNRHGCPLPRLCRGGETPSRALTQNNRICQPWAALPDAEAGRIASLRAHAD